MGPERTALAAPDAAAPGSRSTRRQPVVVRRASTVGAVDDRQEVEADRTAARVLQHLHQPVGSPELAATRIRRSTAEVIRRNTSTVLGGVTYKTRTFGAGQERPSKVEGPVRPVSTAGRGATPAPVGGALPLGYDGGHVLGLGLGGANDGRNVVPMYSRFNRGVWRGIERAIGVDVTFDQEMSDMSVEIDVNYAGPNDTVPSSLRARGFWDKLLPSGRTAPRSKDYGTVSQPNDIAVTGRLAAQDEGIVTGAQAPVGGDVTTRAADFLEQRELDPVAGAYLRNHGHLRRSDRASYPDDPANRPYEYLDVLTFAGVVNPQATFVDGAGFSSEQRRLILQTNLARNGGVLRSDDPNDPAHLPPHNAAALDERGTFNAPEIDHIIPKSSGGSNWFSNARVVSWMLNNKEDRIKNITGLVDTSRLALPAFPTSGTLDERYAVFLPRYAARQVGGFTVNDVVATMTTTYNLNVTGAVRAAITRQLGVLVASGELALAGTTYTVV